MLETLLPRSIVSPAIMLLSLTLAQYLILSGCDGSGGGGSAQEIVTTMGKGPTTYGRHKHQTTTMRYQSHWIFCLKRSCCWFLPRNISCQYTVLRSVDLWIKGSVKSRTFLLRRDASSPPPSGASHGLFYPEIPPPQYSTYGIM